MKFVLFKFSEQDDIIAVNPLTIKSIQKYSKENDKCYILDTNGNDIYIEGSLEENLQKINEALNSPYKSYLADLDTKV